MITNRWLLRVCRTITLLVVCSAPALTWADPQAERLKQLEARLEESLRLIERLSARVRELERARLGAVGAPTPVAGAASQPESVPASQTLKQLQETVTQLSEGMARAGRDTGLPLHGFADVSAGASTSADPARLRGFQAGTLDIYLNPQIGERGRALVETVFEYESGGGAHVEVERLQLGYALSDSLTMWMGRFHTPIGVWNTAFHHGSHLQTTVARPRFLEFEDRGGILPTHTVGVWASGRGRLGDGRFSADAFVGNGPRVQARTLDINAFNDDNASKQVGASFAYTPNGWLRGLTVGAHALATTTQVYDDASNVLSRNRLRLLGTHVSYDEGEWSLMSEYHRLSNTELGSGARYGNDLWYLQVARAFGVWTPYVRLERAALDRNDSYFASLKSGRPYRRSLAGIRYDLDTRSALKLEYSRTSDAETVLIDGQGLRVPTPAARYDRASFEYSVAF